MARHPMLKNRAAHTVIICTYVFIIGTFLNFVIPFWPAYTAGAASLSIIIFGVAIAFLLALGIFRRTYDSILWTTALVMSILGIGIPQIAFYTAAQRYNATLSFDPLSYLTFTASSSLQPSRILSYKSVDDKELKLALYTSSQTGKRPTVVLLHGGAWRYGNYLETGRWPRLLTDHGYTVLSIEYRLASDVNHTWQDAPTDVRDALAYIRTQSDSLSVDETNISLLGQSAGGHLALLEAYRNTSVRSVVGLYAPSDIALDYATSKDKSAELDFVGGPPAQYPNRYYELSATAQLRATSPRTLLVHGKNDDLVSYKNSDLLATRLGELGVEHMTVRLPLTGHSFDNQRGGFASQITEQSVIRFLSK